MTLLKSLMAIGVLAAAITAQDSLQLKDGRFLIGPKMERSGDNVVVRFDHGLATIPMSLIKVATVASGGGDQDLTDEEKAKIEQGLVPFEGKWVTLESRDKQLEKRRADQEARIKEAMSHRAWTNRNYLKTDQFAFEFTIDPDVMKGFAELMEVYYKTFTKEFGIKKPSKLGRLKVCFYHDEDYYYQVTGMSYGAVGYFRFVEPMELNFYYDRLDIDFTQLVMFHETNHYLTTLIDPRFRYPIWANESLAEYYGASKWDPKTKKMTVGCLQEGRLAAIQDDIRADEWQKLDDMLRLEHGEFNVKHYAWGWSFVHWLMQDKKTERKFKDFYLALARDPSLKREPVQGIMKAVPTDDMIKSLLKHLGAKSVDELQAGWYEYIKTLQPSSGRGYYEAGRMALMRGMPIKAQRYLRTAIEKDFKSAKVYSELGQALYEKDKDTESINMMKQAIALDPLNPEFYLSLADAYRSRNSADPEVKRNRWLALEIARALNDPNEYAILVDLGPDYTQPDPSLPSDGK